MVSSLDAKDAVIRLGGKRHRMSPNKENKLIFVSQAIKTVYSFENWPRTFHMQYSGIIVRPSHFYMKNYAHTSSVLHLRDVTIIFTGMHGL